MRRSGSYRRYDPPSSASSRATSPGERRGMGVLGTAGRFAQAQFNVPDGPGSATNMRPFLDELAMWRVAHPAEVHHDGVAGCDPSLPRLVVARGTVRTRAHDREVGRSSGENRIVVMALWCADSCAEKLRILKPNVPRMNPNVPAWARTQHVAGWVIDSAHRRRWREPVKP
jgi:ribosomal protein L39E